jgi:hypothetical protein
MLERLFVPPLFTDIKNLTNAPGIVFRQNKGREKKRRRVKAVAMMLKKVGGFVGRIC